MSKPKQPQNTAGQSGPKPAGSKRAKDSKQAGDPAFPAFQPNAGASISEHARYTSLFRRIAMRIQSANAIRSPAICTRWRNGWCIAV